MKSLFPELDEADASTLRACTSTARSWCDPSQYDEVIGLDFGCNIAHYYMARSGKKGQMPFKQLLSWLLRLPCNTLVVCESAHLGVPQTALSLAQPFTAEELLKLLADLRARGITLKLAPHAHTGKRMRLWVAHHYPELMRDADKSDAADAMALAVYVDRCNEISLANPYKSFSRSARRNFGREVTKLSNAILNAERTDDYGGEFFPEIIRLARTVRRSKCFPSVKFVVTVASTLLYEKNGRLLVLRHRGHVPGRWFWMRDVLRMSPWHHRGGTARSNLMWHTFRPYLQKQAKLHYVNVKIGNKYKKFATYDLRQKQEHTSAMKSFRQMLLRCRDLCLKQARLMNAGELELTDISEEGSCGR
jgi:hypothetical protein